MSRVIRVSAVFIVLAAFSMGEFFKLLNAPALLGYIAAGVLFGPNLAPMLPQAPEAFERGLGVRLLRDIGKGVARKRFRVTDPLMATVVAGGTVIGTLAVRQPDPGTQGVPGAAGHPDGPGRHRQDAPGPRRRPRRGPSGPGCGPGSRRALRRCASPGDRWRSRRRRSQPSPSTGRPSGWR